MGVEVKLVTICQSQRGWLIFLLKHYFNVFIAATTVYCVLNARGYTKEKETYEDDEEVT